MKRQRPPQRKPAPARPTQEQEPLTPAAMAAQLTAELTGIEKEITEIDSALREKREQAAYLRGQLHMLSRINFGPGEIEHGTEGQDGE
jgi:hypothetical protein